jgi:hypothetical protein
VFHMRIYLTVGRERFFMESNLNRLFSQAYFIGGSPCSGKSTIAEMISRQYQLEYYKVDEYEGEHLQRCHPSFLLGVANFPLFPPTQIAGALRQYLTELTARRKQIFLRMEEQRPLPDHVEVMFDYSLTMVEAEIGWLMKTLKKMESCG